MLDPLHPCTLEVEANQKLGQAIGHVGRKWRADPASFLMHCVCVSMPHCARPPGVFEFDNFAKGSKAMLESVVLTTERGAVTIIGEF